VGVGKDREGGKGHACRWQGTEAFLDRNLDKTRELTSSIEPLTYLLRVSLSPTPNSRKIAVLQEVLPLLCPLSIRQYRKIRPYC
jgi:hypothetical protein